MGEKIKENLSEKNIITHSGVIAMDFIKNIEIKYKIKLPMMYCNFISKYNGAYILSRIFDYNDPNVNGKNSDSIAFEKVENIISDIKILQSGEDPDWDLKYRFEDGLIPFGENGGGDMICFDYRKNQTTDNPPIVIWNHDMGLKHRVVFIANNFEEFINMLHESED